MKKIKLKPFNYKKELKKVQGKGIHSKKFKYVTMFSIIGVSILSIFIYRSMAMYSFSSGRYSAFKTTTSKKIKINVKANNGYVEGSLVDKILKDNTLKTETPNFTIGEPPASGNSVGGSGLFSASDEQGTSYYFRGNVNNYVKFAGKTWRIVRINGDGTIRIILDESIGEYAFNSGNNRMYAGYTYNNSTPCTSSSLCESTYQNSATFTNTHGGTNSNIKTQLETWYYNNLRNYDSKIAYGTYCNDTSFGSGSESGTSTTHYGAYERIDSSGTKYGQPTLICPNPTAGTGYSNTDTTTVNGTRYHTYGGVYKLKIGLLSADEMNYAGLPQNTPYASSNNYLYKEYPWWSMSALNFFSNNIFVFYGYYSYLQGGALMSYGFTRHVRPVINLKADVIATGSGTSGTPYVISEEENITKTTDYKTTTTMKVYPNSGYVYDTSKGVTCTNGQNESYNEANNTLTITSPSKDTECTVNFKVQPPKLADKIIADAKRTNTYKVGTTPDFTIGEPLSDGTTTSTGSGLFSAQDDKGTSYYFRGAVNNYVNFADQKWRIVRINGDETIRLILDDRIGYYAFNTEDNERKYVGYTYDNTSCTNNSPCESTYQNSPTFKNTHGGESSNIKKELETWYYNNLKNFDDKIAYGTYCNDTSYGDGDETITLYYGAYTRLVSGSNYGNPTLKCLEPKDQNGQMQTYGGIYKLKIGLLTADEINYAGLPYYTNTNASSSNYLYKTYNWWSLTPNTFYGLSTGVFNGSGAFYYSYGVDNSNGVRPVINLTADILTTAGDGSENTPYEVE